VSGSSRIDELLRIMARLRDPSAAVPGISSRISRRIAPYTIEEAYEVADAIQRGDLAEVVRRARRPAAAGGVPRADGEGVRGHFDFDDVVAAICDKMIRRHPHVFPDPITGALASVEDADAQTAAWEAQKKREREARDDDRSALAGIARGLPEWQRAAKLQKRAAMLGFDWPGPDPVIAKLHEEIEEVRVEFVALAAEGDSGAVRDRLEDEIGDVLFVCVNLARHAKVDFGAALRRANHKFERRFRRMEQLAAGEGVDLATQPLQAQDAYWDRAKAEEKSASSSR
jgi:ATP diphosphatase